MALNPIAYTEQVIGSFPALSALGLPLLSLEATRRTPPLLQGPFVSLSRSFRQGAKISTLTDEGTQVVDAVKRLLGG